MKNILIVIPADNAGGAEQYLKMVAEYYLQSLQNKVIVCFLKINKTDFWNSLRGYENLRLIYTEAETEKRGVLSLFLNLYKFKEKQFDFVYTSHLHMNSVVGILRKFKIIKTNKHIGRESTLIFKRFSGVKLILFKLQYFLGYKNINLLICQSELMKDNFTTNLPKIAKKINVRVVPNPVYFKYKRDTLNKSQLSDYGEYVVSAGRLISLKGFDILIEAFYKVKEKHQYLNLVILGEGQERASLEALIKKKNLEGSVFLKGFVADVYPYFKKAKLCVVSSIIEGFPNVLLQMMHVNTRVVSTTCAGGIDKIDGLITVETNSIKQLVEGMKKALSSDLTINRKLFDTNLENRSIKRFVEKVEVL